MLECFCIRKNKRRNHMIKKAFDETKSYKASELTQMSSEDFLKRYLIKNDNASIFDDCKKEMFRTDSDDNLLYLQTYMFNKKVINVNSKGEQIDGYSPLSAICSLIEKLSYKNISADYKINTQALLEDLETILIENIEINSSNYPIAKVREFCVQFSTFLANKINISVIQTKNLNI